MIPRQKVLLLSAADSIGGMERVVCGLSREFAKRSVPVQTIFPETEKSDVLLAWCRSQGVSVEVNMAMLTADAPHSWHGMANLIRLIRGTNADVVNIHYGSNFISLKDVLAVRMAGKSRCFVTLHQAVSWNEMEPQKRHMTRLAAMLCDRVIAICEATRTLLLEAGVPERKIVVLHCGVQEPSLLPVPAEARQRLGLPPAAFVVLAIAALVPRKGITDLIAAVAHVADPTRSLRLVIAGDGPERASLEAQARESLGDRVIFAGKITGDLSDFYAASDIFALPSYLEGLPLVYLEAAFHGVPSIATRVGGSPEAVLDGVTGLLVPPGDPIALASAIQCLYDDTTLRQRLGTAARTRSREKFTETAMAVRYERLLFP